MKVFYVLYVRDKPVGDCVEAIRFLADPSAKVGAHLTVRGPYKKRVPLRSLRWQIDGERIFVDDVGNFFQEGQNTVFFSCFSSHLQAIWKKTDFGFNPHITIYDGVSTSFAKKLYSIMKRYRYHFDFTAGRLEPYVSMRKQNGFHLQLNYDQNLISRVLGEKLAATEVPELSSNQRLQYIDKICEYISQHFVTKSAWRSLLSLPFDSCETKGEADPSAVKSPAVLK